MTVALIIIGVVTLALSLWMLLRNSTTPVASAIEQAASASVTGPTPAIQSAPAPAAIDALRHMHALALDDERVADGSAIADVAHMPLLLQASMAIARIGSEPHYTPPRPSLLPQLLEVVSNDDASLRTMARIISQDPALTSNLLRVANSALYRVSSAPVESIERASAIIGTQGIRSIIAASLMQPLAGEQNLGRFGEVIWEHSLYSATAAEAFAARAQNCDPFTAHLLGLMHGLGSVAVYRVLVDHYATQNTLKPDALTIAQALDTSASLTAKRIAANWGLSDRTQSALEAQSSAAPVGEPSPLGAALHFGRLAGAAIALCRRKTLDPEAGHALLGANNYNGAQVERVWERLLLAYVTP